MKLLRRPRRVRFEDREATLLEALLRGIGPILSGEDDDGGSVAARERLFPDAYSGDEAAEAGYREMTEEPLRRARLERVSACLDEVVAAPVVDISDEAAAERWIQVLNDLRLTLGTTLGVSEDTAPPDPFGEGNEGWFVYHWLTGVQDEIVTAVMG